MLPLKTVFHGLEIYDHDTCRVSKRSKLQRPVRVGTENTPSVTCPGKRMASAFHPLSAGELARGPAHAMPCHPMPCHPMPSPCHTHVFGVALRAPGAAGPPLPRRSWCYQGIASVGNATPSQPLFYFILKSRLAGTTFAVPDN